MVSQDDHNRRELEKTAARRMRRTVAALGVMQLEQVHEAFDRGGQPGYAWPRLWADSFVGEIPEARKNQVAKAGIAEGKARSAAAKAASKGGPGHAKAVERLHKAQARLKNALAKAKASVGASIRKGGAPLQNTGDMMRSFLWEQDVDGLTGRSTIFSSNAFAPFHQKGFKTAGPNFIPLTKKAIALHKPKGNPEEEGLIDGIDYIMAWRGVDVPARPMIDYADATNKAQIDRTIQETFFGA